MHAILEGFIKAKRYASKEILSPVVIHITQSLSDRLLEWEIPLGKKGWTNKTKAIDEKRDEKEENKHFPFVI